MNENFWSGLWVATVAWPHIFWLRWSSQSSHVLSSIMSSFSPWSTERSVSESKDTQLEYSKARWRKGNLDPGSHSQPWPYVASQRIWNWGILLSRYFLPHLGQLHPHTLDSRFYLCLLWKHYSTVSGKEQMSNCQAFKIVPLFVSNFLMVILIIYGDIFCKNITHIHHDFRAWL